MRSIFLVVLLLLFFNVTLGQSFDFDYSKDYDRILQQTADSGSQLHYEGLLKRFQENDTPLTDFEVLALLIGFTKKEYYKPYSYLRTEREIFKHNAKGEYKKAIALSDSFLQFVPLSQQALIEKSYSYFKLGMQDSANTYSWRFHRIMRAMYESGEGTKPEDAVFALGPADGQNFITKSECP